MKYVIETLENKDTWTNCGEGPFDTRDEACRFAEAEVGARYRIVEVPTPAHTPGPWRVEFRLNRLMVRAGDADVVAVAMPDEQGSKENARLIAAAPELLEVVERIFYSINGLSATLAATNRDYACSTLRKETAEAVRLSQLAIAKAKGGE